MPFDRFEWASDLDGWETDPADQTITHHESGLIIRRPSLLVGLLDEYDATAVIEAMIEAVSSGLVGQCEVVWVQRDTHKMRGSRFPPMAPKVVPIDAQPVPPVLLAAAGLTGSESAR